MQGQRGEQDGRKLESGIKRKQQGGKEMTPKHMEKTAQSINGGRIHSSPVSLRLKQQSGGEGAFIL